MPLVNALERSVTVEFNADRTLIVRAEPAMDFADGFPIGNGRIGVMCYGGPARLCFAISHYDLYYRPRPRAHAMPGHWEDIRRDAFAGEWRQVGLKVDRSFHTWAPKVLGGFQPVAIMELWLELHDGAMEYQRTLDWRTATATTMFRSQGMRYDVTAAPLGAAAAIKIKAATDHPLGLNGRVRLYRPGDDRFEEPRVTGKPQRLGLSMRLPDGTAFDVRVDLAGAKMKPSSISLQPHQRPAIGGEKAVLNHPDARSHVNVQGALQGSARELTLSVSVDVSRGGKARALRINPRTSPPKFAALDRAHIELSGGDADDPASPRHYQRLFEVGRYLFAASTFPAGNAPNLQGIWLDTVHPICDSDYHMDLNVQMAMWHVPAGNLLDHHEPLFKLVEGMVPGARRNARLIYGMRGMAFPATSVGHGEGCKHLDAWPGISGWLLEHFWTHWRYTLDQDFLRDRLYPLLREVSRFYLDYLVDDGRRLIIIPSVSPENRIPERGNKQFGINSTFDLSIFRSTFEHLVQAASLLGVRDALAEEATFALSRLAPYPLAKDGRLREMEDYEWQRGHRHLSHLHPLFPGDQIVPENRPMMRAAKLALDKFTAFPCTGQTQWFGVLGYSAWAGWTYPLLACCYARLGMGEKALGFLARYSRAFTFPGGLARCFESEDMGFGIHANAEVGKWIQIDASLGAVAAVQEMLLQSHGGVIRILPALPRSWREGSFRGLRAEGAFEVEASWRRGCVTRARITSLRGQPCTVRGRWRVKAQSAPAPRGATCFLTRPNEHYELLPA